MAITPVWVSASVWSVVGLVMGTGLWFTLGALRYRTPRECARPAPARWWIVPVSAVGSGAVGTSLNSRWPLVVAMTGVAAVGLLVALAAIDLDVHRLPNAIVLPAYPLTVAALALCSWATDDRGALGRALLAGFASVVAFAMLGMAARAGPGLGGGDVKLAGVLGLLLGWFGVGVLFIGGYAMFVSGGLVTAVRLLAGRTTRHAAIAFGPFMAVGAVLGLVIG